MKIDSKSASVCRGSKEVGVRAGCEKSDANRSREVIGKCDRKKRAMWFGTCRFEEVVGKSDFQKVVMKKWNVWVSKMTHKSTEFENQ